MELIDTHTHIYVDEFKDDYSEMLDRAKRAGVTKFFLPAIDSRHTDSMLALQGEDVHLMMGVHPCSIQLENYKSELEHARSLLYNQPFCAVGEIGIDLHWDASTAEIQISAFKQQIDWAIDLDLPVVIHSRKSTIEVIETLKSKYHPKLRGIFHCFGGNVEEAIAIINLGFKLGIGGVVTFKNAGLDKTVREINLEHLVLETDAPYLAPTPYRGKRNEPAYLRQVAAKIAEIKGVSIEEVAAVTSQNAKNIFRY